VRLKVNSVDHDGSDFSLDANHPPPTLRIGPELIATSPPIVVEKAIAHVRGLTLFKTECSSGVRFEIKSCTSSMCQR
jgi:hypothetical protein